MNILNRTILILLSGIGVAHATPLYMTQYGGTQGLVVETTTGTITSTFATTDNTQTALAVDGTIQALNAFSGGAGSQYDLSGNLLNSGVYSQIGLVSLYDGTTDGQYNYAIDHNGNGTNTVFRFDSNWSNRITLFQMTDRGSGIAYDKNTNTLWTTVVYGNAMFMGIQQYSLSGVKLSEFSNSYTNSLYSLAFDATDNTLWTTTWQSGQLSQLSTTGALLNQYSNQRFNSMMGLEFEYQSTTVPEPTSIALMGLGFAGMGYMRRRKAQA